MSIYIRFRPDVALDNPGIDTEWHGLGGFDIAALLSKRGLRCICAETDGQQDFMGVSEDEWRAYDEVTPPEFRTPWSEEKDPYFPCEQGIAWCDAFFDIIHTEPEVVQEKLANIAFIPELLTELRALLCEGRDKGLSFQFFSLAGL